MDAAARQTSAPRPLGFAASRVADGDLGAASTTATTSTPPSREIGDGADGLVIVGEDHGAPSRRRGEAVEIGRAPRRRA